MIRKDYKNKKVFPNVKTNDVSGNIFKVKTIKIYESDLKQYKIRKVKG